MNPIKLYGAIGALAFVGLLIGLVKFYHGRADHWAQEYEEEKTAKVIAQQAVTNMITEQSRNNQISQDYANVETKIEYVDREVIKKVNVYREVIVNRCTLNDNWVSIHNAATSLHSENPSAGTNDAK